VRDELYDELIRDLEHVSRDVRDTVALFLQDLRDDGVDWRWVSDGYIRRVKYLFTDEERFFREFAGPCMRATRITGSECLQYAHEHGAPWDEWTCALAALNGHLECMKYAHEHGCPWNERTCSYAATNGHLECLKYAHEHGCPWNQITCECAAEHGHLECLQYAHEHGCPWSQRTCWYAAMNGHLECLQYALEHGCCSARPGECPWTRYAKALNEVAILDADERFSVEVALAFHRNRGEISMREFLPLWREHRDVYRSAYLDVARKFSNFDD